MKKFIQKQREILIVVAYVGFVFALVYIVIFPLLGKIGDVSDAIQKDILNQEIVKQRLNEIPKMQEQFGLLEKNEEILDVLFEKNNAVQLIEKLEKVAQETQNQISITMQEQVNTQKNTLKVEKKNERGENVIVASLPSENYLQMKIAVEGSYGSIVNFIDSLENLEYYCDILSLQIRKAGLNEHGTNRSSGLFEKPEPSVLTEEPQQPEQGMEGSIEVVFYTKQ